MEFTQRKSNIYCYLSNTMSTVPSKTKIAYNTSMSVEDNAKTWLKNSGYPFEMEIAGVLERRGFAVRQGEYYLDDETEKHREIDIIASTIISKPAACVSLALAIECKVNIEKPWVLFYGRPPTSFPFAYAEKFGNEAGSNLSSNLSSIEDLLPEGIFSARRDVAYAVTTAFKNRDSESNNAGDQSYTALVGITNAVRKKNTFPSFGLLSPPGELHAHLVVPVVVVADELCAARLDDRQELVVSKCDSGTVKWTRNMSSGTTLVQIVKGEAFADFLSALMVDLETIVRYCNEYPEVLRENAISRLFRPAAIGER